MWPRGGRVLVALSGGPDSVGAAAPAARACRRAARWTVAGVAHLNHGLRAAADDDEAFCRQPRERTSGVPIRVERADVRELARQWRTSIEDAGRRARYAFFERGRRPSSAPTAIATGHTRDDQAETFLLQLIRGAGRAGCPGSARARPGDAGRCSTSARRAARVARRHGAARSATTSRTSDPAFTRNRVRHELMPLLEREFSPGIVDVLAREAAIARAGRGPFAGAKQSKWRGSVVLARVGDDGVEVDAGGAQIACIRRWRHGSPGWRLAALAPDRFLGFDHVERLLALARRPRRRRR